MRSKHQPLLRFHLRPQSEVACDPHSLASSVKTPLEQHPIFKEPETSEICAMLNKLHLAYVLTE